MICLKIRSNMVDRQPSFLVLKYLWLVLGSVIIAASNSKLAGAYEADISGFINIDCGASKSYRDEQTNLLYESDDTKYIDTGEIHEIDPDHLTNMTSHRKQCLNLRSFPQGKRNCYTLKPNQGGNNNYLIRAVFKYGNYDGNETLPEFDLYLGVTKWSTVHIPIFHEIIHVPSADYIDVCLVNIGKGIPYISALELRPVDNSIYRIPNGALSYYLRDDIGGNSVSRYKVDVYDRLWYPPHFDLDTWNYTLPAGPNIYIQSSDSGYKVPDEVMRTAATVDASRYLGLTFDAPDDASNQLYIYFHFAELEKLNDGQKRELRIELNGERNLIEPVILEYLKPVTINMTFPPIDGNKFQFNIYVVSEQTFHYTRGSVAG